MCAEKESRQIHMGFIDGHFPSKTHMCLIYKSEEERRSLIEKFISAAFQDNDRVEYFYDEWSAKEIRQCLSKYNIDTEKAEASGQIRFRQTAKAYHPVGIFKPESMWQTLCDCYDGGICDGFDGVRLSGEMTWALKGVPGSDKLIEYESGINNLIESHPMTVICQYDANRFDGATLMDVLRVHPYMIAQGRIVSNPYYEDLSKSI